MRNELPEWTLPYFRENYTGPMLSDGRYQKSVPNGKTKPSSKLDYFSRDHDTDYYFCGGNLGCQDLADERYASRTAGMSFIPRTIGKTPRFVHRPKLRGTTRSYINPLGGENMTLKGYNNPFSNEKFSRAYDRAKAIQREADLLAADHRDIATTAANLRTSQYDPYKPKLGTTDVYTESGIVTCPAEQTFKPTDSTYLGESPRSSEHSVYDIINEPPSVGDSIYSHISFAFTKKFRRKKKKNKIYIASAL